MTDEDIEPIVIDDVEDASLRVIDPENKEVGELTFRELGIGEGFVADIMVEGERVAQISHVPEEERA